MKARPTHNLNWIFVLEVVITVQRGIYAQAATTAQDLAALCNEKGIANCAWLENAKNQNAFNELIVRLSDVGHHNQPFYASRLAPSYDQSTVLFQYPFARSWRGELDQPADWSEEKSSQARSPFNYDNKRGTNAAFSSWGGKRSHGVRDDKRGPVFSSWGGKRTQKFFNWGGKRSMDAGGANEVVDVTLGNLEHNIMKRNADASPEQERFYNWGGKRKRSTDAVEANEVVDVTLDSLQHSIMKRNADASHDETSAARGKRACIANDMNLEDLFKEFIDWSRKQPEQKKDSMYRKVFGVSALRSPENMSRRAGSFFQWGGKRNTKEKGN